jgi:hypothetical protein
MKIRFECVYEFVGPEGALPNGIDIHHPKTAELLQKCNYTWHGGGEDSLFAQHRKMYGVDVPVFVTGLPIDDSKYHRTSVLAYTTTTRPGRNDRIYIFSINVFGNIDNSTGINTPIEKTTIQNINELTLNTIREEPNFYLMINHTEEGEFRQENIVSIIRDLKQRKIPFDKVIFGTSCYNAENVIKKYLNESNITEEINILKHNWALRSCSKHWYNVLTDDEYKFYGDIDHQETIVTKEDGIRRYRKNKFMSLNYRIRPHRMLFFGFMNNLGILNNNMISYDLGDENLEYLNMELRGRFEGNYKDPVNHEWFDENILDFTKINPTKQVVDIPDIKMARGHGWERKETYLDSYINITTESQFFEDCWYMSEKTFKPIANLQPFIIVGSPHTLTQLKKLGFKTFSEFWDESYDIETDPFKRFEKITKIIKRLNNMSFDDLHELYLKTIPILEHNQGILLNYRHHHLMDTSFYKFFDNLTGELL